MEIRRCEHSDIKDCGAFYDDVVQHLDQTVNYPKWIYGQYPSESSVRQTTGEGSQFLCVDGKEIVGAFVLTEDPKGDYDAVRWSKPLKQGDYLTCHTLAVSPHRQGQGIGKAMIAFCLSYAKNHQYSGVRLDVVPENRPARALYERCGFHYAGDADLGRNIEGIPLFSMYELNFE